jgi:hypothetical protein
VSALELGKLLLALEPEDPLGVLLQFDYLAIRAGQVGAGEGRSLCY